MFYVIDARQVKYTYLNKPKRQIRKSSYRTGEMLEKEI